MAKLSLNSKWDRGSLRFFDVQSQVNVHTLFNDNHAPVFLDHLVASAQRGSPEFLMDRVDHFMFLSEDEWTNSATGAGTAVLTDAHGGILLMSPAGADEDEEVMAHDAETIVPIAAGTDDIWFLANFEIDDADKVEVNIGLMVADAKVGKHHTAGGGVTEGIYVNSPFNTAALNGICTDASADTAVALTGLANGTRTTVGFHYNNGAVPSVTFVQDGVQSAAVITNIPTGHELKVTFAVQTGEAALHTMSVDWYRVMAQI